MKRTGPGVIAEAAPPAAIPATISANHMTIQRVGVIALAKAKDNVTAGFKAPPETPAKHQTEKHNRKPEPNGNHNNL